MASAFIQAKPVMHPLDDKVKALIHGGGEGRGGGGSSIHSNHIYGTFFLFHSDEQESNLFDEQTSAILDGGGIDNVTTTKTCTDELEIVGDMITSMINDDYRKKILAVVSAALNQNPAASRTAVAACLRDSGYNAGVCQTTDAGGYEYIDVIRSDGGREERFIVDMEFAGEFKIARPTEEYVNLIEELPKVYVAKVEEVEKMVGIMTTAVKRSMRARKMHVPPWRKESFMRNKWLGIYKRTANLDMPVIPPGKKRTKFRVHCQAVGFFSPPLSPQLRNY